MNDEELTRLETLAALTGPLRVGDDEGSVTVSDEWLILLRGAYTDEEPDRRYVARVDAAADLAVASLALVAEVRRLRADIARAEADARTSLDALHARCDALEAVVAALPTCGVCGRPATMDDTAFGCWCDDHRPEWTTPDEDLPYADALRALEVTRG